MIDQKWKLWLVIGLSPLAPVAAVIAIALLCIVGAILFAGEIIVVALGSVLVTILTAISPFIAIGWAAYDYNDNKHYN